VNKWFIIVVLLLAGVYTLASNISPNRVDDVQVRSHADSTAEKILLAINQDDYTSFIAELDESLKTSFTESEFHNYSAYVKSNYGIYESKVFVNAIKGEDYVAVIYALKFLAGKPGYLEIHLIPSTGLGPVSSFEIHPPINR